MDITTYLKQLARQKASDLFLSVGAPPGIKIEGKTHHLGYVPLTAPEVEAMAHYLMNEEQRVQFAQTMEMNLARAEPDVGRFRINIYRQRGDVAIAIRFISDRIPDLDELNLPAVLKDLIMLPRGLVLIVGATGSGKSTALASMIDYRNERLTGHILTVEEPVEYLHSHKESIVDQREIGLDTMSYANALKNAMREAPDVIMIGEIRDRETMQAAISYAETGHLCLSTLHSNNANQTLERIINFFPEIARPQLLLDLSLNLQAVVSLRLLQGINGHRVPATEILLKSPYVSDLIAKGEVDLLKEAMKSAVDRGMQTFDESLYRLFRDGKITLEEAIEHADSRTDLQLRIRLSGDQPQDDSSPEAHEMRMEPQEEPAERPEDSGIWIADSLGGPQKKAARALNRSTPTGAQPKS
jgi:twitching motility protein PilU